MADEYTVEVAQRGNKGSIQKMLNTMYEQGWEFVESHDGLVGSDELVLIFRKPHQTK